MIFNLEKVNEISRFRSNILLHYHRVGHHSTSDDSSVYRSVDEVRSRDKRDNPILRIRKYMYNRGCWTEEKDEKWLKDSHKMVIFCLQSEWFT